MLFAYQVRGWLYEQVTEAESWEEAERNMLGGDDAYGLRDVTQEEYDEIVASWGNG